LPETGRRHQLRNHLLSIGNPILGDQEYGMDLLILKGKGLYLHASQLEFTHPFTGVKLSIKSTLPMKFKKIVG
jgi:23S rRNA pseudouridine1911/1915/1917 synthase